MTTTTEPRTDGTWANRAKAAEVLGLTPMGMALLQKDNQLPPECVPCGKIIWRISDLERNRNRVIDYLSDTYPLLIGELFISA